MAKEGRYAHIRMPSGEMRLVLQECRATIGQVGNVENENITIGKAGRKRWLRIPAHSPGRRDEPCGPPPTAVAKAVHPSAATRLHPGASRPWAPVPVRKSPATGLIVKKKNQIVVGR